MDDRATPVLTRIGRPPKRLLLDPADAAMLEEIANSPVWPAFQVRKAKVVLAMANGGRVCDVAAQLGYGLTSIWRCGEKFRKGGVAELLKVGHRTGRRPRKQI